MARSPSPAPADAPLPQNFPPTSTRRQSWPRNLALSPDGKVLLAALNLADYAAVIDTASRQARFVRVGSYPYGAAVTRDGKYGLVWNEARGTVSVIDLAAATKVKEIQVGPHLSHPEGIAVDTRADRAYVAVTHQDLVAVLNTRSLAVERTLSVERRQGIGSAPVELEVTRDGCFLLSANSGEDALAAFALPNARGRTCPGDQPRVRRAGTSADAVLQHEGRRGVELAKSAQEEAAELYGSPSEQRAEAAKRRRPARPRPKAWQLVGRIPVASYPVDVDATPDRKTLVWLSAKGLGVGANPSGPNPYSPDDSDGAINSFQYLPSLVKGMSGVLPFPTNAALRRLTPRASRQLRPTNAQAPPAGTPIRKGGPIEHVFYVVRENRTYDQILGDDTPGPATPSSRCSGTRSPRTRVRWRGASRCSTTCTRTRRRRSTATSGRQPRPCPTTSRRTGTRTTPGAAGRTTSACTRSPGRRSAFCSTKRRSRGSPTSTSERRPPASCRCSRTRTSARRSLRRSARSSPSPTSGLRCQATASRTTPTRAA